MILRTIFCNREGCNNSMIEKAFNLGFPSWGHIQGIMNPDTGEDVAHLCPECMLKIKEYLNNGKLD